MLFSDHSKIAALAIHRHHFAGRSHPSQQVKHGEAPTTAEVENPSTLLDLCEGSDTGVEVIPTPQGVQGAHTQYPNLTENLTKIP